MKKNLILFSVLLLIGGSAFAQIKPKAKIKSKSEKSIAAPVAVNNEFKEAYGNITTAKWQKTPGGNYSASFTGEDGLKQKVEYKPNGEFISAKTNYAKEHIPEIVTAAISKDYSGFEISEVAKTTLPGINPFYRVKVISTETKKSKTVLVSEDGSIAE